MELGSAGHIAAQAQRKLYDRTGEHAIDMRERINEQAWAEPNQMGVFGPAAGGAMAAARSNRPSSATASRGGRREERVRPRSAASSAGGAAALARQRRRADQGTGGLTIDSVDEFDELMHSVDGLLSPEPPSHPSPPPRGRPASASGSRRGQDRASLGGPISFKPRPMSAVGEREPLSARALRLEESLESANGSADVRTARTRRAITPPCLATARHCTPRAAPISPQGVEGEIHRLSLLALHIIVS